MELSPSWEAANCETTQEFPNIYGTQRLITVFTRALHWSLSWASSIQSIPPHHISPRSNLILSTHLRLGLPSGLFPCGFPTKSYMHSFYPALMLHALPISFSFTNYTWRTVQVMKLLIMQFSPTSYHFIPVRFKYSPQRPVLKASLNKL
jgi:hypothetical protein